MVVVKRKKAKSAAPFLVDYPSDDFSAIGCPLILPALADRAPALGDPSYAPGLC